MNSAKPGTIDEYIASFPKEIQEVLEEVRHTVKTAAPQATDTISYAMPAFRLNNTILVYFAAFKNHIGFYALPEGNQAFLKELSAYKMGKGSIQFPLNKPMPLDLITRIVKFRVEEVSKRTLSKKAR